MKARIEEERCVGCAICADICPNGIRMIDGAAEIKDENAGCLKDAADACPQKAIILSGEDSNNKTDKTFEQNYRQSGGIGHGRGLGIGPRDGRGGGRGGGGRRRW